MFDNMFFNRIEASQRFYSAERRISRVVNSMIKSATIVSISLLFVFAHNLHKPTRDDERSFVI